MTDVYRNLEIALVAAVKEMREEIADLNDPPSYLNFQIEVEGRVLDGDVEINFIMDFGSYNQRTKGGKLSQVLEEYLHRYGWNKRHAALALPRVEQVREVTSDHND